MMTELHDTPLTPEIPVSPGREQAVDPEFTTCDETTKRVRPWGPWATIGWTLLCVFALVVAQIVGAALFLLIRFAITRDLKTDDLGTNGNLLAFATLLSTLAIVGLVVLLIYFRGYPIRDYLALDWPPWRVVWMSLLGLAFLLVATDASSYVLGKPLVPTFMIDIYRSSWLPMLVLALVVLAPIGEETLFRGFLYKGLEASRGGPVLAILFSSVAFAVMHALQYDLYAVVAVLATGLYLGFARYWSGSLLLTMLLHGIGNAFATLEVIVQEHWLK